jgi:uncharacterized membrane protein YcaP (DUF421 family)
MFNISVSTLLEIILRTVVVYLVILVGLRLSGKREIGQMTVFDLVVLLLISNAVQNAMVGPDTSLTGGVLAAVVLLVLNLLISRLRLTSPRIRRLVEGTPTLLILHGQVIAEHMRREGIDEESLMAAVREHGVAEISGVEMGVLEIDGSISIVPVSESTIRVKKPMKYLRHQ